MFNLGNDEEISIADLARRVIAACKSSSTVEYISYDVPLARNSTIPNAEFPGWTRFGQ